MFRSFDEKIFRQAIEEKDYSRLKISAVSALRFDPTFERGEAQKVLDILSAETPEIFEEYAKKTHENYLDRDAWTKDYFIELTFWFQKNFSLERISHIKDVGKAVYGMVKPVVTHSTVSSKEERVPSPSTTSTSSGSRQSTGGSRPNPQRASEKQFPVAGALLTAGALVLAGILLYKILSN